jgi:hypothetical protein
VLYCLFLNYFYKKTNRFLKNNAFRLTRLAYHEILNTNSNLHKSSRVHVISLGGGILRRCQLLDCITSEGRIDE